MRRSTNETEPASRGEIKRRHGKHFHENKNIRIGRLTGKEGANERLERNVVSQCLGQGKQHLAKLVSPLVVNKGNWYETHMLRAEILRINTGITG